jgi:hypothetical protein
VGEIPGAIAWPTACQASTGWDEFPKYFAPQLVHAMSRQLRTKVLFGTDYPYIKTDRWRRDFEGLDIDPAVVPLIFKDNALRVLGLPPKRGCPARGGEAMSFQGGRGRYP